MFDKGGKSTQWSKTVLSISGFGKTELVHAKKMKLDYQPNIIHKNKLIMNKRLKCKS